MLIQIYKPSQILSQFVESYVIFEDSGSFKNVTVAAVPNGSPHITIYFGESVKNIIPGDGEESGYFRGAHNKPVHFTSSGHVKSFIVCFKPWGAFRIFGIPQTEMRNQNIELDVILGNEGKRVIEKVVTAKDHNARVKAIDEFLIRQYNKTKDLPIKNYEAIFQIHKNNGIIRIRDLGKMLKTSTKTLERHFKATIGLNPKEYSRIIRLHHVYDLVKNGAGLDVQDIVSMCGYYDQSHFINDVKRHMGISARDFIDSLDEHVLRSVNRMYVF